MPISDADFLELQQQVTDIESEMGNDPSGGYATLRTRLDNLSTTINNLSNNLVVSVSGDVNGFSNNTSVTKIQGFAVSSTNPIDNFVLTWNDTSSQWEAKASASGFAAAGDLFGNGSTQRVIGLQNRPLASTAPTNGQVIGWDGYLNSWKPVNQTGGGGGSFTAGGDLSGSSSSQQVVGLQNRPMTSTAPTNGQAIIWNGSAWAPGSVAASITFAGDLSGNTSTQTVTGIRGVNVVATAPTTNQVLAYNGTNWIPTTPVSGFTAGGDLSGSSSSQTVIRIQGTSVSATVPTTGQNLAYNGSVWIPTNAPTTFTAGGDLSGTISSQTVIKIQGTSVSATAPSDGYVLTYALSSGFWEPRNPLMERTKVITAAVVDNLGTASNTPLVTGQTDFTRSAKYSYTFSVIARKTNSADGTVVLYNVTDATTLATINVTSTSFTSYSASITLTGSTNKIYEARITCPGSPGVSDGITCTNAKILETPI